MTLLLGSISKMMRRRRRDQKLAAAAQWPTTTAKLLKGALVDKDELAEGTLAQDRQLEFPYYFALTEGFATGYFSGYLRSAPGSEGEIRRLQKVVDEGTPITVRYDRSNPDEGCVLARDNTGLSFGVWEG
ncbi:hypothetical protein [Granulicella paludicola]|uniref:hypothetical protein n=1 Tax=Granulicella paludicola TaxID=474951 RepID=UPI0021E0C8A0|nr:hypothetical protein [Granulicella paludicola]